MVDVLIISISLFFSAFFSGMEIAYISSNKISLEIEKKKSSFSAKIIEKITDNPSKFITTMLIGNNISLVIYGFSMGEVLTSVFQFNFIVQTLISTLLILITAEFLPKVIFQIYSVKFLKILVVPAYFFYILFFYISDFIIWTSEFFLKVFFKSGFDKKDNKFSMVDLEHYINESIEKVDNNQSVDNEVQIFQNAFVFSGLKSRDIMVPRIELSLIEVHDYISNLKNLFIETGFSKILVYKDTVDDIIGYVHAFDLYKKPKKIKSILIPVDFVPESMLIKDVFKMLKSKRRSVAIVIDEYGSTSGMLTIEDIIEELFGEIDDEFDNLNLVESQISAVEYHFSASLIVSELNKKYNFGLPENPDFKSLGGLIMNYTDDMPKPNDLITIKGYQIRILKATSNRISVVSLSLT